MLIVMGRYSVLFLWLSMELKGIGGVIDIWGNEVIPLKYIQVFRLPKGLFQVFNGDIVVKIECDTHNEALKIFNLLCG